MKIVLLDASTLGDVPNLADVEQFGEFIKYEVTTSDKTIERLQEADVVITNKVVIDKSVMVACPQLKLICVAATGMNNIDLEAASELGVEVKNVAGYSTKSVAQHTFTLLFSLIGHIEYYDNYVKSGQYAQSPIFTHLNKAYWEIAGKKIGIIGLGTIGSKVAEIAEVFGMSVLYYSTSGKNDNMRYKRVEIDELLQQSDVVSIHAPLNEKTQNLIGINQLKKMKQSAILLNTGRGGIVNEEDLIKALNNNEIAAAGLDVLAKEPISEEHPLVNLKDKNKLIITPHIAWASKEARYELVSGIINNLKSYQSN